MRTLPPSHVILLCIFFTLGVGKPFDPQVAWSQEHECLHPERRNPDSLVPGERLRPQTGTHLHPPSQAARPAKSLPSDVQVFNPVQTFTFDQNPDNQLNFDFIDAPKYAGDINGDGANDYIHVNAARDERTSELEDWVYKTAVFFGGNTVPSEPDQVLYEGLLPVGDLNGDGKADAVVRTEEGVRLYTGSSAGYQDSAIQLSTKPVPSHLAMAYQFMGNVVDIDGDGFDDVLIGSSSDGFDVAYGAANLNDVEVHSYLPEHRFGYVYNAADLDGDGPGEIVRVARDTETNQLFLSVVRIEDRETLFEIKNDVADDFFGIPASLWLVDVTDDGALEIIVSGHSPAVSTTTSKVFLQESELSFSETPVTFGKSAIPAGDLNGDGRHDFYTRKYIAGTFREEYYISYGPSTLTDGLSYDEAIPADAADVFERVLGQATGRLGDVTGDGKNDAMFAVRNYADRTLRRLVTSVNESGDLETLEVTYPMGEFYSHIVATHNAGDLNGDGIDDIAMVNVHLGDVYLFYGGSTIDSEPDAMLRGDDAYWPYHAAGGDFNGDGHGDLAVAFRGIGRASSHIAVYLGPDPNSAPDHTIAFDEVAPTDYSNGFSYLAASDVDGDGDDDLFAASSRRRVEAVFVFLGRPSLPSTPDRLIDYTELSWRSLFAGESLANLGDVNGDGVDDVAIGLPQLVNDNGTEGAVHVYYGRNETGPDFDHPDQILLPPASSFSEHYEGFAYGLAGGGDFNGDGFLDVAVAPASRRGEQSRTVHLFFGSEMGLSTTADLRLRAPENLFGGGGLDYNDDDYVDENVPHLQFIPDVDGDGDDELIMTSGPRGATNAVAYLGDSGDDSEPSAVFRAPNQKVHLGGEYDVAVGDFTGSGSLDYVLTQTYDRNDAAGSSRVYRYAASVLPVELTSFTVTAEGSDAAILRWQTASETDNAGFRVQHRRPGKTFSRIAFVDGAGTTQQPQSYRYTADELAPGRHVFRLEQVNLDGTTQRSQEVDVQLTLTSDYTLSAAHPNPFRTRARLRLMVRQAQDVTVAVYDALGRHVQTLYDDRVEANQPCDLTVQGTGLASGAYFVLLNGEHFTATRRLTRVR